METRLAVRIWAIVAATTLAFGCTRGHVRSLEHSSEHAKPSSATEQKSTKADVQHSAQIDRRPVTLAGESKGADDADINIVVFADFQCPFCSQSASTIERVFREYPGRVRLYFRHLPLESIHPDAFYAAEASLAAGAQGKFWPMHDVLFANQKNLKPHHIMGYARELGLDMTRFAADMDNRIHKSRVDADISHARELGIKFTPVFLINGLPIGGLQPFEEFKLRIDEELARIRVLAANGVKKQDIYATLMKDARVPTPSVKPSGPSLISEVRYRVDTTDSPKRGAKSPLVTIVAFSDFQCSFCAQAQDTLKDLLLRYPSEVQVVFKHMPLPFHDQAAGAALAAESAGRQGKFWTMHDKLFANQHALGRGDLDKYAREIGLDMRKFWKAFDDVSLGRRLDADAKDAQRFGLKGTPSFFVNGRLVQGALSLPTFQALIDAEIKLASEKIAGGIPRARIYAELTQGGLARAP